MSSYTEVIKEAFATARSDVAILDTIEIGHPSLPTPLFLIRDFEDRVCGLEGGGTQLFTAAGFSIEMPSKDEKGFQDLSIAVDNTNRIASDFLKSTLDYPNESVTVKYRPYLSNDLSTPQMDPPLVLYLSNARITAEGVVATATFADIINKTFPNQLYTKERFPAL